MRKFLATCAILAPLCLFCTEDRYTKPLWEEDQHFCYYRTLCLEGSVSKLDSMIKTAKAFPEEAYKLIGGMEIEIINCKNALGMPINEN